MHHHLKHANINYRLKYISTYIHTTHIHTYTRIHINVHKLHSMVTQSKWINKMKHELNTVIKLEKHISKGL